MMQIGLQEWTVMKNCFEDDNYENDSDISDKNSDENSEDDDLGE